jgi:hypothetical protein
MACTESYCVDCKHVWFSNSKEPCPRCGHDDIQYSFDEETWETEREDNEEE